MRSVKKIGVRDVRAMQPGETLWDSGVAGFGARRQVNAVSFVLSYRRRDGRQVWHTIGRLGSPWTPDTARDEAKRILGLVVAGVDPAAEKQAARTASMTVAGLCDLYLADARAGRLLTRRRTAKQKSTLGTDAGRIERHIKPLIGRMRVADVKRADIERFMHDVAEGKTAMRVPSGKLRGVADVSGGKGTASRTVGLLGAVFTYAVQKSFRSDNPVHGVVRYADQKRERRLSDTEYRQFGTAMILATDAVWPPAVAAARFLVLTGWRRGEALNLRWTEVDLERRTATLPSTKTGRSMRPLAVAACDIIRAQPAVSDYVFAPARGSGVMGGFPGFWKKTMLLGNLPPAVTPHVLRHSYASLASDLDFSESTIAALIGHARHTTTSQYVHTADAVLLAAADRIADEINRKTSERISQA